MCCWKTYTYIHTYIYIYIYKYMLKSMCVNTCLGICVFVNCFCIYGTWKGEAPFHVPYHVCTMLRARVSLPPKAGADWSELAGFTSSEVEHEGCALSELLSSKWQVTICESGLTDSNILACKTCLGSHHDPSERNQFACDSTDIICRVVASMEAFLMDMCSNLAPRASREAAKMKMGHLQAFKKKELLQNCRWWGKY